MMFRSRSRRQLLLLDCCYSGAFAKGLVSRADKKIHTGDYFEEGRGRIVLTASDSMQYSFEADILNVEVKDPGSIFTRAIIDGLNTGKAEHLDKDGRVSYDELYDYTYDRVIDETPLQRPGKWVFGVEGDVIVARNPNWKEGSSKVIGGAVTSHPSSSLSSSHPVQRKKTGLTNPTILLPVLGGIIGTVIIVALISGGIIHLPGGGGNVLPKPLVPPAPINHPPSVTNQSITTNQNTPVNITLAGSDPDKNDTLTAAIVSPPSSGKLSDINQDTGVVTYTPNSNFTGHDSFTFKVNDGKIDSNIAIVNIRVGRG